MPEMPNGWFVFSPEAEANLRVAQEAADLELPDGRTTDVFSWLAERDMRRLLQLQVYRMALLQIVNVLGPDGLCKCARPCEELRTEAWEALELAQSALQRGSKVQSVPREPA